MKPICVKCERFMRVKKIGYYFLEGMPVENRAPIGLLAPEMWKPYKLWSGDLFECPDCKAQTIVGVATEPIAEHYYSNFAEVDQLCGPSLLVKDC